MKFQFAYHLLLFCLVFLFASSQVFSQSDVHQIRKDTTIVDTTSNEIITVKYTAAGRGGGRGGSAARTRLIHFSVEDTLGNLVHSGLMYKRLVGCSPDYPYTTILSQNPDGSYESSAIHQKMFGIRKVKIEYILLNGGRTKSKRVRKLSDSQERILRKIDLLANRCSGP